MPKYSDDYIKKRRDWWIAGNKIVASANYQKAVQYAKLGLRLFPNDVVVEFRLYAIECDYYLTGMKNHKSKNTLALKKTILKMKKLLRRIKGQPLWAVHYMKNEYYFQSKQFKKQYELGIGAYEKTKDKMEMYSAGVGGAQCALVLAKKGQMNRAKAWARKSIKAWKVYFEVDKKYYNPYVHLALAYGILGEAKKMERALKTSARLCGKDLSYKEFQEVIDEVEGLS